MFDRILVQITLALIGYVSKRLERGHIAVDVDSDRDTLRRAGGRLDQWLLKDGARKRGEPDADRPQDCGARVCACRRRMDAEQQPRSNP